jgi:sugar lactone lactonase YvrE
MRQPLGLAFALGCGAALGACGGSDANEAVSTGPEVMDLDPASPGVTMQVESITADSSGNLYIADRISLGVLRLDPEAPPAAKVATLATRPINGTDTKPDAAGMVFDAQGGLLIASGPFAEILRIPSAELDAQRPGNAETFATGVSGANAIVLDEQGRLYVSGGATGNIYRVPASGGAAETFAKIEAFTRSVPPDGFMMNVVANGLAFDSAGALLVADTARGAIWKIAIGSDDSAVPPVQWVQSPMLEGIDGLAVDASGMLWGAVNEQNEIVTVTSTGTVTQRYKNDSKGPFEYPAALVFVGRLGYVVNLDRPRRDNFAADGMTSIDGVGASIVVIPDPPRSSSSATPPPDDGYNRGY